MSDNENGNKKPGHKIATKDTNTNQNEIAQDISPGEAYVVFIEMNNLSNKLKLLDYEDEYLLKWKMKPLSR
jgi:hypothetical protein